MDRLRSAGRLGREKVLEVVGSDPRCVVVMEACASAHSRGRETGALGHEVKLVAPALVKPCVKRQKNGAGDAEAICEAAQRPTMRFVAVRSEDQQARGFRTRDLLVGQRTGTINALRGHLAEFGVVAAQGPATLIRLAEVPEDPGSGLLEEVREPGRLLVRQIAGPEKTRCRAVLEDADARWLMTIPGVGPITAMAVQAFAPPMESFRRGRDFSAWLGLVPRQHTTGGKPRLGRISKMGQRDLRRLLITGTMSVVRHAGTHSERASPWLAGMLARKPKKLVAMALANRMARIVRALMMTKETCHRPSAGNRRRCRKGKGKRSTRRDRGNRLRARTSDQDLIRVSPYGPAAREHAAVSRPDRRQHLTAHTGPGWNCACI